MVRVNPREVYWEEFADQKDARRRSVIENVERLSKTPGNKWQSVVDEFHRELDRIQADCPRVFNYRIDLRELRHTKAGRSRTTGITSFHSELSVPDKVFQDAVRGVLRYLKAST